MKLRGPGSVYLRGALSLISIVWVFVSAVFFLEFWLVVHAVLFNEAPEVVWATEPRFGIDGLVLLLTLALAFIALLFLMRKDNWWAGRLQLASCLLLVGHSAVWITTLGAFHAVQVILWGVYFRYDFPPQAILLSASIFNLYHIPLQRRIQEIASYLPLRRPRTR